MSYDYRLDKYYDESDSELDDEFVAQLNSSERYKDLIKIASGGMKTIYKAFDQKSQRYVAYATVNQDASTESRETFIKEARLTAKLNHPNIIPVYNIGLNEKQIPFFTMELKNESSLRDIIDKLKNNDPVYRDLYTLRERLEVFVKVCDAIAFAHSKKVIHLDIKPDNIQVGSFGEVIVCDWGLSKVFDRQAETVDINQKLLTADKLNTSTLHGHIKGSPGFMAPEQITGEKKTSQTDIFSLGALLYSLLSYEAPFRGEDLNEILKKTIAGKYPSLPSVPKSIEAVLTKAMASKATDRYDTVNNLKKDIQNFLEGYATEAEEASSFKLLKLFIIRNKALSSISISSLFVIIIGTAIFISNIQEEKLIAQKNLRLFKEQKEETSKAQREYYQALIDRENYGFHSNFKLSPFDAHQKTIKGLKELVDAYPKYREAKSALAYHFFISQEFIKSEELLMKDPGIYSYLLPLLKKFKTLKEDHEVLSSQDFVELLKDIKLLKPLHFKMLMLYSAREKDTSAIIPAVKHILKRLNPDWDAKQFTYMAESRRMNITGKKFYNLSLANGNISPIRALKIKALSLRGTSIDSIRPLADNPIRSLDISNTPVPFYNFFNNQPKALLRLIISSEQYQDKQIAQLPSILEIKFSDK